MGCRFSLALFSGSAAAVGQPASTSALHLEMRWSEGEAVNDHLEDVEQK